MSTYPVQVATATHAHTINVNATSPASALDAAMAMPGTLWASVA